MKITKYIVLCAASLSFVGCGVYSNYQREEVEQITSELYNYIEASADSTNLASVAWRELFTDPALQALIEEALERNTDLEVARLSVEQAQIALSVARKAFLPSLGVGASAGVSLADGSSATSYQLTAAAGWEIDLFGRLRNSKRAAAAALEQSEAYRQAIQTQLVASVASSYYTLLMLDEQLRISEQTQTNWDESIRAMEAMMRAGRINETAILQAQASSVALRSSIVSLRESIASTEISLSALLALPSAEIQRGTIAELDFTSELLLGVPLQLLTNRPDVRAAEASLVEAFYLSAAARSSLYPSLNIDATALLSGDALLSVLGSLTQPIFSRGTLKAQVKISEAQQEQARMAFSQAVIDAAAEVNAALVECQSAEQRLTYSAEQRELLERAVAKTSLLMKHGQGDYLDVLTSQLSLLSVELAAAADKFNQTQGVINLYRALGGGE